AINAARRRVTELYGDNYLSKSPRRYQTNSKGAQEAHEAIRPAGGQMLPADSLPISGAEKALYDLIWKRTVATQMAEARLKFTTVQISVEDALFRASGRTILFPGFFRAYVEGNDDPDSALDDQDTTLPELAVDEVVDVRDLEAIGHETKPPARYTEASLVKALESEGIGRPSTYATIINTIQERGYCFKQRKELVPTFVAFAVTQLLEDHFEDLVDLRFTADMEQALDDIAEGDTGWLEYLRRFYQGQQGLETQVKEKEAQIDPRLASQVGFTDLPAEIRIGQFGPFLARGEDGDRVTAGLPDSLPPADLDAEMVEKLLTQKEEGPEIVGEDPASGKPIYLKVGPYGPYVQLGDEGEGKSKKPKRVSLLKGMKPEEVDLDLAQKLLSLPRPLGAHPESGKEVRAGVGRFGPFVVHDGTFVSIKPPDHVLEIELARALELLAAKPEKRGSSKKVLKDLGEHPDGGAVQVLDGRYGPYVNHKRTNASLPENVDPQSVTMEQAVQMLSEKKTKKKGGRRKS
ncbi:MAG: DNA topoisomerase I, partial [Caldilineaceae bacterium]|nr:DNA topoisomerase I [Caldilineaceae bacterium]